MIKAFRQLVDALQGIAAGIADAVTLGASLLEELQKRGAGAEGVEARLEALERSRALWEAEMEGVLLEAENKFKASRSAEERSRGMLKRAQALTDSEEGDFEGIADLPEEYLEALRARDAAAGEAEGMHPLHAGLEARPPLTGRERARLLKFGG